MKNIHRTALLATALCALVAVPSAFAAEPVLPADQYVKLAKDVNAAGPAEATNAVKAAVSDAIAAAGDAKTQAVGEVAAALAAVSAVTAESDAAAAAAIFENAVVAASNAGSGAAEKRTFANVAAAAGALVTGGADFLAGAGAGLSKNLAKEVKAALDNVDETLADVDTAAIKDVFADTLDALRAGSYKMREDGDAASLLADPSEIQPDRNGIHVGAAVVSGAPAEIVVPKKKKGRGEPTPTGGR